MEKLCLRAIMKTYETIGPTKLLASIQFVLGFIVGLFILTVISPLVIAKGIDRGEQSILIMVLSMGFMALTFSIETVYPDLEERALEESMRLPNKTNSLGK